MLFSLFLVGIWAGHVSMIPVCSMLYGDVWQYSHGFPIFSIVRAPSLALFNLFFLWKLILFFSNLWYYCVEFSAFDAAIPFLLPFFHFVLFNYAVYFFFPNPVLSLVWLFSSSLASWSAFSLPSIPQCAWIQHICVISFWCLSM